MWIVYPIDQETRKIWSEVLGTDRIRVLAPRTTPIKMFYRGAQRTVPSYFFDTHDLGPDELERLIDYIARTFTLNVQSVRDGIHLQGIPIPAQDVQFIATAPYVSVGSLGGRRGPFYVKYYTPGQPSFVFFMSRDWGLIDPKSLK